MTGVNLAVTRCPENFASPSPNDCQVLGAPANIDLTWTAAGGPTTSNYQQITRLGSCLVRTFDLVDTFRTAPAVGTLELEGRLHTSTGGSLSSAMTTSTSRCVLPPSPPASAAAHPRRAAAVVSWHDASSSPRWPVVQYIATAQPGGASCTTTGTQRWCVLRGLHDGTTYRVTVVAGNIVGFGAASRLVTVLAGAPDAPRTVTISATSYGTARASWLAPQSSGSGAVTAYRVRWSSNGGRSWTPWAARPALSAIRGGLKAGHVYIVQVRAINRVGAGPVAALTFRQAR